MKTREKEILLAANTDEVIRDTYCDSAYTAKIAFMKGAAWADAHPALHVVALVEALKEIAERFVDCPTCDGGENKYDIAREALAAYHKATKGDESL